MRFRLLLAQALELPQAFSPTRLNRLFGTFERQRVGRHVLGYYRAGADIGAVADLNRRDQRRIGANEGPLADIGAMLGGAVIITGDGAGANIGAGTDVRVADISQVIGLGAGLDLSFLYLDEIADMHVGTEIGAGAQPGKRSDAGALADVSAFQMRERADRRAVGDRHARPEHHVWLNSDVLAEFGIGRQKHGIRCGHRDTGIERGGTQTFLQDSLRFRKLRLGVDAAHVVLSGFNSDRLQTHIAGYGNRIAE